MPKYSIPQARIHLKKKKPTDKQGYLIASIRFNHKQLTYSLTDYLKREGVYPIIDASFWNAKAGQTRFSKKYGESYKKVNDSLKKLKDFIDNLILANFNITHNELKQELHYFTGKEQRPEEKNKLSLFDFIEQLITEKKKANTSTWEKYYTSKRNLEDYIKEKDITITYDSIDWEFRTNFVQWMYEPPREHSTNHAAKIIENLKLFLRESYKLKYHQNDIFRDKFFNVKRVKTKMKVRLDLTELKRLQTLDLSNNVPFDKVRDLFIAMCFTGLRISDWGKVKKENIVINDGKETLEILTKKTKAKVYIPILSELKTILEKYEYHLPKLSDQYFNRTIKEVCRLAGINNKELRIYSEGGTTKDERIEKYKMVTSHCARRSFASNFYNLGIEPFLLMQITGHTTEKQFFEYIDLDGKEQAKRFAQAVELKRNQSPLTIASKTGS